MNEAIPLNADFGRDLSDSKEQPTTGNKLCPDFLFYIKNCLIFRGEEEEKDFEKAKSDLSAKLVWNNLILGNLPYILGYCASRDQVEFFALTSPKYNLNEILLISLATNSQ
jgi:hypothetical protein